MSVAMMAWRSASVALPMREWGGRTSTRCTGAGIPLSCRVDTSASPTPSSVIALKVSSPGCAKRLGGDFHHLLLIRGIGAQGVLYPVAQLRQYAVGHIAGALGDEIHAHALERIRRTTCSIFPAGPGRIIEQQVGLIEKNTSTGCSGSPSPAGFQQLDSSHNRKVE